MNSYILIAALWIAVCIILGIYIAGKWFSGKTQYRIGFFTIFITFLAGISFLLFAVFNT